MKRLISFALVLTICFSLCACGGSGTTEDAVVKENGETVSQAVNEKEPESSKNRIVLGEKITMDFAEFTFDSVELGYSVGGSGISTTAQDGMRLFSLTGSIENIGGSNLSVANVNAEMTFNGEYTYTARATINDSKSYPVSVAPLVSAEYVLYAEIPEALMDKLGTCEVRFSLNEDFASVPESADEGDYAFVMELDEPACQAALTAAEEAHIFFQECPILPTPENYAPVYQSTSSSSSVNGKVSSIRYGFSVQMMRNDDVKDIYATYLAKVQELGFSVVNDTGSGCDIYAGGTKLASVSVEGSNLRFEIVPGNENVQAPSSTGDDASTQIPVTETVLKMGDTIETDYVHLTLDEYDSDMEIQSGTSQYGSYTYYYSDNGDPYFYLKGTFKNLGGVPVDIRHIYVQFCFDGKYNYKGEVAGASDASNGFINDISPLAEVTYYIYAAVPQELIDTFRTCSVRIGFTENFDYKVVDVNDLPKFENCDDVFVLEISK